MMRRSLEKFKKEAFKNTDVEREYRELSPAYELRKQLIRIRKSAGMTQEQLAKKLNTQKSNISRLEDVNSKISPKLSTIEKYAKATGYKLQINFIPQEFNHISASTPTPLHENAECH